MAGQRAWVAVAGALACVFAMSGSAQGATTVSVYYDRGPESLDIEGDDGRNLIRVTEPRSGGFTVRDPRGGVVLRGEADEYCERLALGAVHCDGLYLHDVVAGAGPDRVVLASRERGDPTVALVVYGGLGRDVMKDGKGETLFNGGPGNDTIRAGGGADAMTARPSESGRDAFIGGRGPDTIDAVDRKRDRVISCGRGKDKAHYDARKDPNPGGCEVETAVFRPPKPRSAPPGFFGVVSQGPLAPEDYELMGAGRVGKLRVLMDRAAIEGAPGIYDWSGFDRIVQGAAANGIEVLPVLFGTPAWAGEYASPPISTPHQREAWKQFLVAAVDRYGPDGDFWAGWDAALPIGEWQLWNEPNFRRFYQPRPSATGYGKLVRISADAIRPADPKARIVLGGVAAVHRGAAPRAFLRRLYATEGIRRDFDAVALHPYAPTIDRVGAQIEGIRRVMARAGDGRTPLEITEVGWASDGPRGFRMVTDRAGQAERLDDLFTMLRRERRKWRLSGAHWYAWQDAPAPEARCSFCQHSGLFDLDGIAKPAWRTFRTHARD